MEYFDAALKAGIGVIAAAAIGWVIAKISPLRDRIDKDAAFRATFISLMTLVCLMFIAIFAYDRFILPNEINQSSQESLGAIQVVAPRDEPKPSSCKDGYYAVGVEVTGNSSGPCTGCLNRIRVLCKKL